MTMLPSNATKSDDAATNSDRSTVASKNHRRRRNVTLSQLPSRQAQVHPKRADPNVAAAAVRPRSRFSNPEAIHDHSHVLISSNQRQNVHRIGSGPAAAAADGSSLPGAVAAAAVAGPPSPPRRSTGQASWPSPVKFQPEPSRIIKISSDPTLSRGRRLLRERLGNANNANASWYHESDDEDHEARAEDERMYDLATWRMYHRIMEARQRRQAESAMLQSHPDGAAAPTAQDVERMVLHVKEQAKATYQQRLAIMEDAIAIASLTSTTDDDDDGGAGHYYDTTPTDEGGPPFLLSSTARSPRGLIRMLARARKISIGADTDTQGLFPMDM